MRFRNWFLVEVLSGIGLGIFGFLIHNDSLFDLGFAGTMLPMFHNLIDSTFWSEYKLKEENKYAVNVLCNNCHEYNFCKIPIGVKVETYIKGKKCWNCDLELEIKECSLT